MVPLLCGIVCALAAYVYVKQVPNIYRSEATLFFPTSAGTSTSSLLSAINSVSQTGATESGGSVGLLGGMVTSPQLASGPNTSIAVLASERCRRDVASKLDLVDYWKQSLPDVLNHLDTVVSFGINKYGLLQIEATDRDPLMAARMVQTETESLKTIAASLTSSASRRNRIFVYSRLAAVRARLVKQQALLTKLQIKGALNMTGQAQASSLVGIYAGLMHDDTQTAIDLDAIRAKLRVKNETALRDSEASTELPSTVAYALQPREKLRQLEGKFALAQKTLGTDNPQYRLLSIEVTQARKDVEDEVAREVHAHNAGISTDVADLYAEESSLAARKDGLDATIKHVQGMLLAAPGSLAKESRLTADALATQSVVSMLQGEGERARMAEARDAATFVVIDTPTPADKPFAPRRAYTTALALLAGLLLGIAWLVADSVVVQRRIEGDKPSGAAEL